MRAAFGVLLVAHAFIHLLGFAKGFDLAALPQLTQPISPASGMLWLLGAVLFLAAAVALFVWPLSWWMVGGASVVVSTIAIASAWSDAKFGTIANLVIATGVVFGFLAYGPASLRAAYDRDVERGLAEPASAPIVTESDLLHVPEPVQRYLRLAGVVGQPRVFNLRARMHGRIRSGQAARWIPIAVEQFNFFEQGSRLFYLNGSMLGVPVQGFHRYVGPTAAMTVKAAALVRVAEASGPDMTRSETVTMFNDMCFLAPATLSSRAVTWEAADGLRVRARFTNAGQTIRAELVFNEAGELVDFVSDDRYQTSSDGSTARKVRWSTPLSGYRRFGPVRLASSGEGRWHEPAGDYSYIELTIDDVQYNVRLP